MNQENSRTLVKVGKYIYPLEAAVRKFSGLEHISFGLGNTVKYARFEQGIEPYLLIVSQEKHGLLIPEYNVMLTITSYTDTRNQEVAQKFSKQTEIPLDVNVPETLTEPVIMKIMNSAFQAFEKNPEAAMAVLR